MQSIQSMQTRPAVPALPAMPTKPTLTCFRCNSDNHLVGCGTKGCQSMICADCIMKSDTDGLCNSCTAIDQQYSPECYNCGRSIPAGQIVPCCVETCNNIICSFCVDDGRCDQCTSNKKRATLYYCAECKGLSPIKFKTSCDTCNVATCGYSCTHTCDYDRDYNNDDNISNHDDTDETASDHTANNHIDNPLYTLDASDASSAKKYPDKATNASADTINVINALNAIDDPVSTTPKNNGDPIPTTCESCHHIEYFKPHSICICCDAKLCKTCSTKYGRQCHDCHWGLQSSNNKRKKLGFDTNALKLKCDYCLIDVVGDQFINCTTPNCKSKICFECLSSNITKCSKCSMKSTIATSSTNATITNNATNATITNNATSSTNATSSNNATNATSTTDYPAVLDSKQPSLLIKLDNNGSTISTTPLINDTTGSQSTTTDINKQTVEQPKQTNVPVETPALQTQKNKVRLYDCDEICPYCNEVFSDPTDLIECCVDKCTQICCRSCLGYNKHGTLVRCKNEPNKYVCNEHSGSISTYKCGCCGIYDPIVRKCAFSSKCNNCICRNDCYKLYGRINNNYWECGDCVNAAIADGSILRQSLVTMPTSAATTTTATSATTATTATTTTTSGPPTPTSSGRLLSMQPTEIISAAEYYALLVSLKEEFGDTDVINDEISNLISSRQTAHILSEVHNVINRCKLLSVNNRNNSCKRGAADVLLNELARMDNFEDQQAEFHKLIKSQSTEKSVRANLPAINKLASDNIAMAQPIPIQPIQPTSIHSTSTLTQSNHELLLNRIRSLEKIIIAQHQMLSNVDHKVDMLIRRIDRLI